MERAKLAKELWRLICSKGNDAVKLAYLDEVGAAGIGRLDLRGVTEIKRSEKGCFEVRFVDKLRAVELLEQLLEKETGGAEMDRFLQSLRGDEQM